jgi:hypothetical protein
MKSSDPRIAQNPIAFVGALGGSACVAAVGVLFVLDAIRPAQFGRPPDLWGLLMSFTLFAYVASVWLASQRRFGRALVIVHVILAALLFAVTALLLIVGVGLLASAKCGFGAGMGAFAAIAGILLAFGLVPAEVYWFRRRHAA